MADLEHMENKTSPVGYMTERKERLSYWSTLIGQNFSYSLLVLVLPTFLLMTGVNVAKIAAAILVVKIWDAVNDTIFGFIFDKVKFKSKLKCIPWIRLSAVCMPIVTFLMFLLPANASENFKMVWFIVSYILWDTVWTFTDVPIYSLANSMTSNLPERNRIVSIGRICSSFAQVILFMVCTVLISEQVGMSFPVMAAIVCVVIALMLAPLCINARERIVVKTSDDTYTLKTMINYLGKNKYLLLFYCGFMVSGILGTAGAVELFVSYYLFGSALFSTLMMGILAVPGIIVAAFMQKLLRRFDKFLLYRTCVILTVALSFIIYFVGYRNIAVYIALAFIRVVPFAVSGFLNLTFTPDCVEYGLYKTGVDARGISYAVQTFVSKINGVSQSISLFIIGLFGWITIEASSFAELEAQNITQSPMALNGLWITYTLVPAIGGLLSLIPYSLYRLNDKDIQVMAKCNCGEITKQEAETKLSRRY